MTEGRVPRRVSEVNRDPRSTAVPGPLRYWRNAQAYVLLGEPGSGKTTAFEMERDADLSDSEMVQARDFAELDISSHPEWRGKTLFIDGLDEIRTASSNWREPLDSIRRSLKGLGHPRFRLSCRAGEWLGEDDEAALRRLSPYGELVVLHLEPLSEGEFRTLLERRVGPTRASELMSYAHEYDLYGFLQNPLNVKLLMEAGIRAGQISGPRGLFEASCKSMIQEQNTAHRAATRGGDRPSEAALLKASGRLCAISLLTDSRGWSVDPAVPTARYPSSRDIEDADPDVTAGELDRALGTRLFRLTHAGCFEPIHRKVAEFLGGRFLGELVERRIVSPARLRSLMAGDDGIAVLSLRGLAAWIAVHSPKARPSLIRDDPIGMAVYGDASGFSFEDQRQLLSNLRDRASEVNIWKWPDAALPPLATPGALPIVRDLISARERDDATQSLVYLALRAMAKTRGSSIPGNLRPPLLGVARDPDWWPGTRESALEAWVASLPNDEGDIDEALKLLNEIREGKTNDPRRGLTGWLLYFLYPEHVTPQELWGFARPAYPHDGTGMGHWEFWRNELPRRSEDEGCLADVLDSLCQWLPGAIGDCLVDVCIRDGVAKLLDCALEQHGDEIETERLYAWLAVVLPRMRNRRGLALSPDPDFRPLQEDITAKINAWLRARPSTQKALILEIIRQQDDLDIIQGEFPPGTGLLSLGDVLAGAPVGDFAPWFLEQAVSLAESRPELARHMLARTGIGTDTLKGLALEEVRTRVSGHPLLEERLEQLLKPVPQPSPRPRRTHKRKEWIDQVRRHADALGQGEGPPKVYHEIARAYLGINNSVPGDAPVERIRNLFLDDEELSQVALNGLRRMAGRTDLPTLEELVGIDEDGRESYFVLPGLAALEEEERTVNQAGARLEGDVLQRALGSLFLAKDYGGTQPAWYRRALRSHPEEVADAFAKVYGSFVRRSSGVMDGRLRALTRDESHRNVARAALPRLLRSFPAKASTSQVFLLDDLIPAALELVDRDELASIVHRKLKSISLRIGHRIRWLATGMLLGERGSAERLDGFLTDGSNASVRELAAFLRDEMVSKRIRSLPERSLAMLVRRVGAYFAPTSGLGLSGDVEETVQANGLMRTAIDVLSLRRSAETTELFQALIDDEALAAWREPIAKASDAQRLVRLDAEFEPPMISDVMMVLKDAQPANAADLAALAADRIRLVGEQVRDSDADLWRHYWSEEKRGKPMAPKVEHSCQSALLAALRPQLPERVRVDQEATHAGRRRADLQVSFNDFAVPVETKMSSSRDLWTAVTTQLIPRYTRDPRSDGYGIYVVFWHGPKHAKTPTPRGEPPRTPDELEDRLQQELSADVRRKIPVIVLDVSPPWQEEEPAAQA